MRPSPAACSSRAATTAASSLTSRHQTTATCSGPCATTSAPAPSTSTGAPATCMAARVRSQTLGAGPVQRPSVARCWDAGGAVGCLRARGTTPLPLCPRHARKRAWHAHARASPAPPGRPPARFAPNAPPPLLAVSPHAPQVPAGRAEEGHPPEAQQGRHLWRALCGARAGKPGGRPGRSLARARRQASCLAATPTKRHAAGWSRLVACPRQAASKPCPPHGLLPLLACTLHQPSPVRLAPRHPHPCPRS